MISPCRSAKWPGTSFHPSAPKKYGPPMSRSERERPERALRGAVQERRPDEQPDPDRGADRQPDHRTTQPGVVAAREHEQADVRDPDDAVGERRTSSARSPKASGTHSDDQEQRRHRDEDHDPHRALLRIDDAGQPRVADPRPPQHPEHKQRPARARPRSGRSDISCVHWVIASTKTRSKNSSSGITRSPSRSTVLTLGVRALVAVAMAPTIVAGGSRRISREGPRRSRARREGR